MLFVVILNVIMLDVVAPNIQQVGYFSVLKVPLGKELIFMVS
jgi:hypothetical protein